MRTLYPQNLLGDDNAFHNIMAIQVVDVVTSELQESIKSNRIQPNDYDDGDDVDVPTNTEITTQKEITKDWIYLPAPQNISYTDTMSWENGNLGKFRQFANKDVNMAGLGQDVLVRGADIFDGLGSEDKANAEDIRTQSVTNPHMEILFKAPNFRTFQFEYKLVPFEENDCNSIREIIKLLRYGAATSNSSADLRAAKLVGLDTSGDFTDFQGNERNAFGSDNYFAYPSKFGLKFLMKTKDNEIIENPHVGKIKKCVISEITINNTSIGTFSTYENGFPAEITLSISFTETEILSKASILEGF